MPSLIGLQFCFFPSLAGRIIGWGTQAIGPTGVNHVDVILPSGDLLGAQHESGLGGKPAGVQIRPASYVADSEATHVIRVFLPAPPAVADAALAWAMARIGTPYDTEAVLGIADGEDRASEDKLICSGTATGMLCQPSPAFMRAPAKHWRIISPEELLVIVTAFAPWQQVA